MQKWTIGNTTVTRIEEQLGAGSFPPEQYFTGFDREVLNQNMDWLVPHHYIPSQDALITSVHSWLIQTPHHTILLDSCSGNHKDRHWWPRFHQLNTPFLERLAEAGVQPADISMVLCTHLHADHIGWNTCLQNGRWVPTFPNAKYLFSRIENDYWDPSKNPSLVDDPARRIAYVDSVLPVIEAGQARLVEGVHQIDDNLLVEPAPGHTPGHILLKLNSAKGQGVFCGDVIHHPLQIYAPDWNTQFCQNPEQARATRRRMLCYCAETGAKLFPTHFGAPHVTEIEDKSGKFLAKFITSQG
jgi:glyoxylase-like metal-dependent hydrolase (beta-lactamase superfamily II)